MRGTLSALAAATAALAACGDARPIALTKPAGGCSNCHGGPRNAAPPYALSGATATSDLAVGAHQLHARDTPIRSAVPCRECHLDTFLPDGTVDAGRHLGAPPAEVAFGPVASARGASPAWTRGSGTCSGLHCHGATMRSPPPRAPTWTFAAEPDPGRPGRPGICATCHGWPPPPPHPPLTGCNGCHPATVPPDGSIDVAGGKHIDGALQVTVGGGCAGCHGFPPATGAHLAHFGLTGVADGGSYGDLTTLEDRYPAATPVAAPAVYAFGCGHCHPLDPARHLDGILQVELADAAAPPRSLKALASPGAAYGGGCSGVYCHSSGQQASASPALPVYVATPAWTSGAKLGCSGCHRNPPDYASGGPGALDANGHLGLRDDDYVWGHFGGMPGPSLYSKHGKLPDDDAAPITCQTCHSDTVDPGNTGPSGFYYLDTSGGYAFGGGILDDACASCHTGAPGSPASGSGRVLPLRHVNGTRDVAFDPRTTLPSIPWLPAAPNTPSRPYWAAGAGLSSVPPNSGFDGSTWSLTLGSTDGPPAAYERTTKTCSNVACHLESPGPVWGAPYLVTVPVGPALGCCDCHRQSICGL